MRRVMGVVLLGLVASPVAGQEEVYRQDFEECEVGALPQRAEIEIGQKAEALLLLHNTAWSGERGTTAAAFTVHYAEGQSEQFEVRTGTQATDWWTPTNTEASAVAITHSIGSGSYGLRGLRELKAFAPL